MIPSLLLPASAAVEPVTSLAEILDAIDALAPILEGIADFLPELLPDEEGDTLFRFQYSDTYLPYFEGLARSLDYGTSYVAYAVDDHTFSFVTALRENISRVTDVTSSDAEFYFFIRDPIWITTITFSPDGSEAPTVVSHPVLDSLFYTTPNSLTYAEFEGFPQLIDREVSYANRATFILLLSACVFYFLHRMRASVRL